ncbi:hypothetical protein ARC20_07100 [Stenotrophomonas panacihumi]|uniref:Uncharacterized protein n=2 Tax=Stenotrophomonas panacihumi TaxID=676599 RepID=A0A0R0AXA1_9GAMM|nr:hypothetical protein ARC20_07100 [Stenotrophomonas panacihumi]
MSSVPVAIVAQQWAEPRMLGRSSFDGLDHKGDLLRLHFNYHAQIDPEIVCKILWGFRASATE